MAADVLELGGYEVDYLGADVPPAPLVEAVESRRPDIVGLSSTLAPEPASLLTAISRLRKAFPEMPILVGGHGASSPAVKEERVLEDPGIEGLVTLVGSTLAGLDIVSRPGASQPLAPLFEAGGSSAEGRMLGAAADAADLARIHARMAHSFRRLAYEDTVVKGPNRRSFDDRIALLADSPEAAPVAVLMLDLDAFKQINDTYGHPAGDDVLRGVFEAIDSCLREGDFAARLGGDEFALLLPRTELPEAVAVARRVLAAIRAAGVDAGTGLTATIGIAPLLEGPRRAMLDADIALYRAKASGGDSIDVADRA